jgi:hypothetical protein
MIGGTYSYEEGGENGGLVYKDYFGAVQSENFKNFSHSVWKDDQKQIPTYTLYGEFTNNKFKVTNGALQQTLGSLSMFYNTLDTGAQVYVARADGDGMSAKEYKYNCATSAFSISLDATVKAASAKYCTFATLNEDGKEELNALLDAIDAYIKDNYGESATESDFVQSESIHVDQKDPVVEDGDYATFKIPNKEIKIEFVKVKKY